MWAVLITGLALFITTTPAHAGDSLDIVVYGATGEVGSHVVREALDRGHRVIAVSRNPAQIEMRHENLSVVRGDLLDKASVTETVTGRDVVILSVRGVIGDSGRPESALQFIAAETLVDVLFRQGDRAPRLIHVGGSGALEVEPGVLFAEKLPKILLPKGLEVEILGQILALEFYRKVDDVRWTYVTPPKNFTNGPRTGVFRIGGARALEDDRGFAHPEIGADIPNWFAVEASGVDSDRYADSAVCRNSVSLVDVAGHEPIHRHDMRLREDDERTNNQGICHAKHSIGNGIGVLQPGVN